MNALLASLGFLRPKPPQGANAARANGIVLPGGGLWAIHEPSAEALIHQWQAMSAFANVPASDGSQAIPMKRGNVAVVEISGPMSRGGTPCFGAGSTVDARTALRAAERDADVTDIVFVMDSPGGTVAGTGDLGDEVYRIAQVKPVHFFVPDQCCSAGYWVASQGTTIWASPNAQDIGNINARRTLINVSESLRKAGVEVTILKGSRGTFKDAGDGSKPFSEEEIAYLQAEIDGFEAKFAAAVARGRGVSLDKALEWSDGRWFDAPTAKAMGLIDQTGTLDDLMRTVLLPADPLAFDPPALPYGDEDDDGPDASRRSVAEVALSSAAPMIGARTLGEAVPVSQAKALAILPPLTTTVEPTAPAPAQKADPVSASGGEVRPSAGNSQAPTPGAENKTGKKPMRQQLMTAFVGENMGTFVDALNKTTSDDPELLAGIIARTAKAQIAAGVAENPVVALAARNDIHTPGDLNAVLDRAKDGDTYLSDVREDAKKEAIRAFGENGPMVAAAVEHQGLVGAKISRDAWRAQADKIYGIGADGSAPTRKTAPNPAVATDATATDAPKERAFLKLDKDTQAHAINSLKLDTEAKQDEYAEKLNKNLAIAEASAMKGVR